MRLIPGSECLRVYSILGTRPFRNSGAGAGAGISDSRWDPRHLPGCVYLGCTNTAAFGSGAVGFPADPISNGGFETGDPPTGWTQSNCVLSRQPGTRTGGTGSYVMRVAYDGSHASGGGYESGFTAGNVYSPDLWARGDGTSAPEVTNGASVLWAGTTSTDWQRCYLPNQNWGAGTILNCRSQTLSAGHWVEFDDITAPCRNSSQLTDLTGLGHHLVQATAASQPLWVASGSGGVLRTDGVADSMYATAWGLVQPAHAFLLFKPTYGAGQQYYLDGGPGSDLMMVYNNGGVATAINMYAGATLAGPTNPTGTTAIYDMVFAGASSAIGKNGAAPLVGNAGASNAGGLRIGSRGGVANFATADFAAVIVYNRALSEAERQRVVRWLNRQKAFLAL